VAGVGQRVCAADERDPQGRLLQTLERADWPETRIVSGNLSEEHGRLKREPGNGRIAYGGATFGQALSRLGLVDECRLMIQPAALGAGLRLFKDLPAPLHPELIEAATHATGVAIHVYRPRSRLVKQAVDPDQLEQVGKRAERPSLRRPRGPQRGTLEALRGSSAGRRPHLATLSIHHGDCRLSSAVAHRTRAHQPQSRNRVRRSTAAPPLPLDPAPICEALRGGRTAGAPDRWPTGVRNARMLAGTPGNLRRGRVRQERSRMSM
jgi:RibD C-terminal domain